MTSPGPKEQAEPTLSEDGFAGLADMVEACRNNIERLVAHRRRLVAELAPALAPSDAQLAAQSEESLAALEETVRSKDMTSYFARLRARSAGLSESGLPFRLVARAMVDVMGPVGAIIDDSLAGDPVRGARAWRALRWLETQYLVAAGESYTRYREEQLQAEYAGVIRRMSTPVVEVWEGVLVLPVIGIVDSDRARQMTEQLLERIADSQARIVILDVTGVPTVDGDVADDLLRTAAAVALEGTELILAGLTPQFALTLVRLGVSLAGIDTFVDLGSALQHALARLGYGLSRQNGTRRVRM
jgi:anti-anti-sigma regulatory factor